MELQPIDEMSTGLDLSLFALDEIYHKLPLPPHARPSLPDNSLEDQQLASTLSASSYPYPKPASTQKLLQSSGQLYGGLMLKDGSSGEEGHSRRNINQSSTRESHTTKKSSRKRGRPRKKRHNLTGEDPEEHRRIQVRRAQRAHRLRNEIKIMSLKNRISQLETATKEMNTAILSFRDKLIQSGALDSNPELISHLHDTVQACMIPAEKDGPQQPRLRSRVRG